MDTVEISLQTALIIHAVLCDEYELLTTSDLGTGAEKWVELIRNSKIELIEGIMATKEKYDTTKQEN
jgi:hypothetical protein